MNTIVILLWFPMHPSVGFEAGHIAGVYRNAEACATVRAEKQKSGNYELKGDVAYPIYAYPVATHTTAEAH